MAGSIKMYERKVKRNKIFNPLPFKPGQTQPININPQCSTCHNPECDRNPSDILNCHLCRDSELK